MFPGMDCWTDWRCGVQCTVFCSNAQFSTLLASLHGKLTPEAEMRMAFLIFDRNGDGVLSSEEITAMIKRLEPELASNEELLQKVFQQMVCLHQLHSSQFQRTRIAMAL